MEILAQPMFNLTYLSLPGVAFLYPWKHQKTFSRSDVFTEYRKATPGCKGLMKLNGFKYFCQRFRHSGKVLNLCKVNYKILVPVELFHFSIWMIQKKFVKTDSWSKQMIWQTTYVCIRINWTYSSTIIIYFRSSDSLTKLRCFNPQFSIL